MKQLTLLQLQEVEKLANNLAEVAHRLQNEGETWHSWENDFVEALHDMAHLLQALEISDKIEGGNYE